MAGWSKNQWADQWKAQRLARDAEQGTPSQTFVHRVLVERGGQAEPPGMAIGVGPSGIGLVGSTARTATLFRPLEAVKAKLAGVSKISSEAEKFGRFMQDQAAVSARGELGLRDLVKAYTITKSSIQRSAISRGTVEKAWPDYPGGEARIRPEEAFSEWLSTPPGKAYLDAAEAGQINHAAIEDLVQKFRPFGMTNTLVADMQRAPSFGKYVEEAQGLVTRSNVAPGETLDKWLELAGRMNGIGGAKTGFMGSLLGAGDIPVADARQLALHILPGVTKGQTSLPSGAPKTTRFLGELSSRQSALGLAMPADLEPYRQFLTHYTIWDKVAGTATEHAALQHAMKFAAVVPPTGQRNE